jgi:hypothetical protein
MAAWRQAKMTSPTKKRTAAVVVARQAKAGAMGQPLLGSVEEAMRRRAHLGVWAGGEGGAALEGGTGVGGGFAHHARGMSFDVGQVRYWVDSKSVAG